jgi:hypothetical protein
MKKKGALLIVLALVAVACTTSVDTIESTTTTGAVPVGPLAEPPSPPQIIPLLRSTNDDSTVAGQTIFLTSKVLSSEPIERLELWVNGEKLDEVEFDVPIVDPPFSWEWVPGSVGLQAATVRAFNESGEVADSFPSWFRVVPAVSTESGEPIGGLPASPLEAPTNGVTTDTTSCEARFKVLPAEDQLGIYVTADT